MLGNFFKYLANVTRKGTFGHYTYCRPRSAPTQYWKHLFVIQLATQQEIYCYRCDKCQKVQSETRRLVWVYTICLCPKVPFCMMLAIWFKKFIVSTHFFCCWYIIWMSNNLDLRSSPTICGASSGSKLFAKVIFTTSGLRVKYTDWVIQNYWIYYLILHVLHYSLIEKKLLLIWIFTVCMHHSPVL